jgi:hypothetical protein
MSWERRDAGVSELWSEEEEEAMNEVKISSGTIEQFWRQTRESHRPVASPNSATLPLGSMMGRGDVSMRVPLVPNEMRSGGETASSEEGEVWAEFVTADMPKIVMALSPHPGEMRIDSRSPWQEIPNSRATSLETQPTLSVAAVRVDGSFV